MWKGSPIDPFITTYLGPTRGGGGGDDDDGNDNGGNVENGEPEDNGDRAPNFHQMLPAYVTKLLDNPTEIPDGFETQYGYAFGDLRAIIVHDLRNEERGTGESWYPGEDSRFPLPI